MKITSAVRKYSLKGTDFEMKFTFDVDVVAVVVAAAVAAVVVVAGVVVCLFRK